MRFSEKEKNEALMAWNDTYAPGREPADAFEGNRSAQDDWIQHYFDNHQVYQKAAAQKVPSVPAANPQTLQQQADLYTRQLQQSLAAAPNLAPPPSLTQRTTQAFAPPPIQAPFMPTNDLVSLNAMKNQIVGQLQPNPNINTNNLTSPVNINQTPTPAPSPMSQVSVNTAPINPPAIQDNKIASAAPISDDKDKIIRENPYDAPKEKQLTTGQKLGQAIGSGISGIGKDLMANAHSNDHYFNTIFGNTQAIANKPIAIFNPIMQSMSDQNAKKDIKPAQRDIKNFLEQIYRKTYGR